jgi:hypothetical protein
MGQRVDTGRSWSCGVISAAGVIASLAFVLPARAESRRHDGFYAAANIGVGYMKEPDDDDRQFSLPISLLIGSTYGKVAFGGSLNTNIMLNNVAAFADIYPDPKGGFHVMPSLGWSFFYVVPSGPVLGVGVGYDFWVGSQVSMGVMARFTYFAFYDNDDDNWSSLYEPALLYTVTYQ